MPGVNVVEFGEIAGGIRTSVRPLLWRTDIYENRVISRLVHPDEVPRGRVLVV